MTKEELYRVKSLTCDIHKEEARLLKLKDWINRITQEIDGLPHEQSYKRSSVEELATQIIDCERNIDNLKLIKAENSSKLVKKIDDLISDEVQKTILVERYVFCEYFKKIAKKINMSEPNVYFQHRKGLKILYE